MNGLFNKYIVHHANGTPSDEDAIYFVLRLDTDRFAQTAAHFYAFLCQQQNPALSADLLTLLDQLDSASTIETDDHPLRPFHYPSPFQYISPDKESSAIELLRQVEWVQGGPGISESYCPSCY